VRGRSNAGCKWPSCCSFRRDIDIVAASHSLYTLESASTLGERHCFEAGGAVSGTKTHDGNTCSTDIALA
jgi:hypothetical protein